MNENLKQYYKVITESWQMLKHFTTTGDPDTDAYWNEVIAEASRIGESYGTDFARKMVSTVINELERNWRAKHDDRL